MVSIGVDAATWACLPALASRLAFETDGDCAAQARKPRRRRKAGRLTREGLQPAPRPHASSTGSCPKTSLPAAFASLVTASANEIQQGAIRLRNFRNNLLPVDARA